jgi:MFS family permease
LAEIPSNLILNKYGARRWIARILITWGVISALTAFVWDEWSFYSIRFVLGLAEAGFYPGVVLYLTWWFPSFYRSRMQAIFQSASVISLFIGPPLGGLLLYLHGMLGLSGWQWLFLVEGLPPIIMCFVIWHLLTDRPNEAKWLTQEQRDWLVNRIDSERAQREAVRKYSLVEAVSDPKILLLTAAWFGLNVAGYGLVFFLPLIVRGLGVSADWLGLVSAAPYLCAFVGMIAWGYHSDLTGERTWHVVGALLLCSFALAVCTVIGLGHPVITMVALCLAATGTQSIAAAFWALPSAMLTGTAAAGAIAMINAVGNLGGWLGPTVFGLVKDATGSSNFGLLCLAAAPAISAVLVLLVGQDRRLERMLVRPGS